MNINNILVPGNYEQQFQEQLPQEVMKHFRFVTLDKITEEDLRWADAYVGSKPSDHFHPSQFKWVHSFNAGVNNYLDGIDGWFDTNIILTRTVCSFGERISEYCLSYVLRDLQFQDYFAEKQMEKIWEPKTPKMVKNETFVIFGTGEIGQKVAETFSFFGADVYGVSKSGTKKSFFKEVVQSSNAESVLNKANWIISTLPYTKETNKLFDRKMFSYMNDVGFINVGRGSTVDEAALIEALNDGNVRSAVLDVTSIEPLPENSKLWERNDVKLTPHISAVTEISEAITCFLQTFQNLKNEMPLMNRVDITKGY
ncbi:D-2-hydroxyacid dehydrogenase [Sutcliffiella cohnii]|uniref:D-2-hydroxyacid dehydrogenase n=1 Tax=Sutcliffiella cohnii TaxID=33932 RepID=UPI002E20CF35|nr:D-2-hydroxyacid dehydrogenase [Sutcliffiella cohnii]